VFDIVPVFNEGERGRVRVFELLGLKCGHNLMQMIQSVDKKLVTAPVCQSTQTASRQRQKRVARTPDKDSTDQSGAL